MSDRRDAAAVLAMCAWVRKRISKVEEKAKLTADVSFRDEKTAGVVDGKIVSYTRRVTRRPSELFTFLDESGFVEWVEQRWPTEITKTVRKPFLELLYQQAVERGDILTDDNGEVCEHVKVNDPIEYTATYLQPDADEVLEPQLSLTLLCDLADYIEMVEESV